MTMPEPQRRVAYPIALLRQRDVIPSRYLMHIREQHCAHCGRLSEWSELYAVCEIPSRTQSGIITNLVAIDTMIYNVPLGTSRLPPRIVPSCHECVETVALDHLPDPRREREWEATLIRKAQQDADEADERKVAKRQPGPRTSRKLSIEELLDL